MKIVRNKFSYIANADDTTFFLKDRKSIIELINDLITFSHFSGLKPNKTKCEITRINVLNGVQVTLCCIKCIYLNNKTVKKLGVHFSYNKNLKQDKKYCEQVIKIENILKVWLMTQFKSFAVSEVIHPLLITKFHQNTIHPSYKIQKNFI